jgi:hypothetical protein
VRTLIWIAVVSQVDALIIQGDPPALPGRQ